MGEKFGSIGKRIKEIFKYKEVNYLGLGGISEMYEAKTYNGESICLKLNPHTGYVYKKAYKDWNRIGNINL